MSPIRLLFATTSAGKLREGRELLAGLPLELTSLAELGLGGEVLEDAPDYLGNARLKARAWAARSALATLSDDSGLEVVALPGELGVRSARFGGAGLDDEGRNRLLLARLEGQSRDRRKARYVCVLVLVDAAGREVAAVEGECRGHIVATPRGSGGFGYDPLFEPEGERRTFAEMSPGEKAALSHRGRAFRALRRRLEQGGVI